MYESIKGRNAPGSRAQRCGRTANVEVNMRILHREFSQVTSYAKRKASRFRRPIPMLAAADSA